MLAALPASGRDGFYLGAFGDGLLELGDGLFSADDLGTVQANWIEPLTTTRVRCRPAHDRPELAGLPHPRRLHGWPNGSTCPSDPDDERWAHLLIEAASAAGFDRPDALHEGADGDELLATIDQRLDLIGLETRQRDAQLRDPTATRRISARPASIATAVASACR